MKEILEIITAHHIRDVSASTRDEVLVELCDVVADASEVTDPEGFLQAIRDREKLMSTGIGHGIAIPHARTSSVSDFVLVVGRSKKGIDYESLDGLPVHIIILMGAPERKRKEFLTLISKVGELFIDNVFKEQFLDAGSSSEMTRLLKEKTIGLL